jgi:methyl-accepting chemotaxis protein
MLWFKNLRLAYRLIIIFLTVGIIPLVVVGIVSLQTSNKSLSNLAYNQLISIRDIKKNQVLRYFQTLNDQMVTISENRMVIEAMREFTESFPNIVNDNNYSEDDIQSMQKKLSTYYTQDFSTRYAGQRSHR